MIIKTSYIGTTYSALQMPPNPAIMLKALHVSAEGNKEAKVINMKITAGYRFREKDATVGMDVFSAISSYSVLTDGSISVNELYKIYYHAMLALISGLHEQQRKADLPEATDLQPLTLDELSEELVALSLLFSH